MDVSGAELEDAIDNDEDFRVLRFLILRESFHRERSKIKKCEL